MKNFRKILFNFTGLAFSTIVLMQCGFSNNNSKNSQTNGQATNVQEAAESSYVNLYDGRSAFPDSVHKSWQTGNLDDTRTSVLTYIDNMISGVQKSIEKYEKDGNAEKLKIEKDKLERVKSLKEKIQSATDKNSLKNLMHDEFRSGKYKDLFGTGK